MINYTNYNGFNIIIIQNHENGDRIKTHKKKELTKNGKRNTDIIKIYH